MRSVASLLLNEADCVAVLPDGGVCGDLFKVGAGQVIALRETVPAGHKAAVRAVPRGGAVLKYGHPIGEATDEITPGDWVHGHNLRSRLTEDDALERLPGAVTRAAKKLDAETFMGYARASGRPGIRNDIWVIPTVGCINGELRALAGAFERPEWISGVKVLEHPLGCSQTGWDLERTADTLAGLAQNPNAAGVLIVGLGCENLAPPMLTERLEGRANARFLSMQEPESDGLFVKFLRELAAEVPRVRTCFPMSDLAVGVKCGGSDGYSGVTANPLLGRFADSLAASGGTVIAAEIPEMFGAEGVLAPRMSEPVFESFVALDRWFRGYFARCGRPVYENPSPGNVDGGITTLEEKSLGAVEKTGGAAIVRVLKCGEPAARTPGVQITFSPGNDLISCTAMVACGAQMILFTTGRGTPFGSVVPTLKISTNSGLASSHPGWIDFDAGTLIENPDWETATGALEKKVTAVANGERTANERKGHGEIALFKDGVTL